MKEVQPLYISSIKGHLINISHHSNEHVTVLQNYQQAIILFGLHICDIYFELVYYNYIKVCYVLFPFLCAEKKIMQGSQHVAVTQADQTDWKWMTEIHGISSQNVQSIATGKATVALFQPLHSFPIISYLICIQASIVVGRDWKSQLATWDILPNHICICSGCFLVFLCFTESTGKLN